MESNMFTDEQLEILRKGFQEHDFTQTVPLNMSYEDMTPKRAAASCHDGKANHRLCEGKPARTGYQT